MTVLVVEDDEMIAEGLRYSLLQEGYQVLLAGTVAKALEYLKEEAAIEFCLLDIMLPDGTGYEVCRAIRKEGSMPILFLTACDDEVNTVMALEQGGDDYISKPFRIRELLARMKAVLRRTKGKDAEENSLVIVGDNQVNLKTGKVYRNAQEIILTAMEYKLLLIFINHRGQTLSRRQILEQIWDEAGDFVNDNTLTVYIKRLRKKLGDMEEQKLIQTVRGLGYRMDK